MQKKKEAQEDLITFCADCLDRDEECPYCQGGMERRAAKHEASQKQQDVERGEKSPSLSYA